MSYKSIFATIVMVLALSLPAEAQFLEKLTKGLDKVNKGLDKVEKVLKFDETLKKQAKKTETTTSSEKANSSKQDAPSQTGTNQTSSVDVSGWKAVEPTYPRPYISEATKFLKAEPYEYSFSDVHDGVFAVKRGFACEFWKVVTGEKLFAAEWKYASGEMGESFPTFSNGVAVARRTQANESGQTPIYLLYLDGRIKELNPSWITVSQFMDGVALVTTSNYNDQVFYIDITGKRLYPNLKVGKGLFNSMRPLRDGLRAYYDGDMWGFIDAQGNIKIAPRYREVDDFSNGYAWGKRDGIKELIDVTGKVVFTLDSDYTETTDVSDNGVFYVVENGQNVYYDITGKEIASPVDVSSQRNFKPYGLATIDAGTAVIDPKGNIVLKSYDNDKGTSFGGFGQFSESGYMKATDCKINGKRCAALIKPSGEIAWLFSKENLSNRQPVNLRRGVVDDSIPVIVGIPDSPDTSSTPPFKNLNSGTPKDSNTDTHSDGGIFIIICYNNDDTPGSQQKEETIPVIDPEQEPKGPIITDKFSFTVNALASPAEGGSVSISPKGKVEYGKEVTISASPNKDWAVRSIETDAEGTKTPEAGKPFAVFSDQTVTVNFVKKETEEAPDNFGTYQGTLAFDDWTTPISVYAEINQRGIDKNPYGVDNYGFVSIMFDPEKSYVDKKGEVAVNLFAAPLKIVGIQKIDTDLTRQWIVVEGGSMIAHNIIVAPKSNAFLGLMVTGMLYLEGLANPSMRPRRYRIEMLDRNPETGEFRFGKMETYSVKAGAWVDGGDLSLQKSTEGIFVSYSETGYDSNTFVGAKMKKTQKRNDIRWYPPQSWYEDQESYQQALKSMEYSYQNDKSDYEQLFAR